MPDSQDLSLVLGSNGGEAPPADAQNVALIFGLTQTLAEGYTTLTLTAAGLGAHGVAGAGVATLQLTAEGIGELLFGFNGDGLATLAISVVGVGQHGVRGDGLAAIALGLTAEGFGQHAVAGVGAVTLLLTPEGLGYLAPTGLGVLALLGPLGVGQFLSLGFDPTKRMATGFLAPWGPSRPAQPERTMPYRTPVRLDRDTRVPWGVGARRDAGQRYPWGLAVRRDRDVRAPWGRFARYLQPEPRIVWTRSVKADRDLRAPWGGPMVVLQRESRYPWTRSLKADRDLHTPWGGPMVVRDHEMLIPWGQGKAADWEQYIPWTQYSRQLSSEWGIATPSGAGPTPGTTVTVPIQRVYIVQNAILLTRLDTLVPVPAFAMTLSLDVASWTWGFSASVSAASLALLQPNVNDEPVELQAAINGTIFQVFVERISRERAFGQAALRIAGRGRAAILDKPYAAAQTWANSGTRTAEQLANDVLTLNGVPIGWSVDWQISDWLVPAGALNVRGSHMDAVLAIARAGGAYVQPDPIDPILRIKALYPTAPWNWGSTTPDFILPAAAITRESIEWIEKPSYNGVYVSGQAQGILAHVRRTGTAGDVLAEMVTDPLNTATLAARQRGIAVLSDTGKQAMVRLRLPVLPATDVIQPGAFIQFVDGAVTRRGYVRSTQLDVGHPETWQVIEVETHGA